MKFLRLSARGVVDDLASDEVQTMRTCVTICHSMILTADGFSSESPDEEVLVSAAAMVCAKFVSRIPGRSIFVELVGAETEYDHLAAMAGLCAADESETVRSLRTLVCWFTVAPEEEWTDFKARLNLATANGTGGRLTRQSRTIWLCWGERHTSPR
jgi:hypothetical protein